MTTLALISLPLADSNGWGMHGTGWWAPMMIGMVLFWGAIILGIVWLVRGGFDRRPQGQEETALSLLDRRFAEGALSLDDYHQRRKILSGAATASPAGGADHSESEVR
jgi:putative membrane protein